MSSYAFYFIGIMLVVFLVAFVGFYAYRLGSARKKLAEEPSARLGRLMAPADSSTQGGGGGSGGVGGSAWRPSATASDSLRPGSESRSAAAAETTQAANGVPSAPRVREQGPGLRAFTLEAVFLRRDRTGEVSFQIGDKPTMPLKFLLDAKSRAALDVVAARATADFGGSWAILASEDEEGWLTVTRLY